MKTKKNMMIPIALGMFLFMAFQAFGGPEETGDNTLSPYFFVQSDEPGVDRLPLKSTRVDVNVSGVIADVTVTQVYKNEGQRALEAIYVFPASTRAAVYGMKMRVGERTITAKIKERGAAREAYENARESGRSASLLEQHRPNVFQMNVANILPSDVIQVELKYTELLVPTDAVYEFVYPTVVGPRYAGGDAESGGGADGWIANPYLGLGEKPTSEFDIRVHLNAGLPIQRAVCDTHPVTIGFDGKTSAAIRLDPAEKHGGDRDFILKYRLAGGKIQTGVILAEGETENFFLLMAQPPKKVRLSRIPPREYIFIVDVSGSMNGFPLDISKKLLKDLIGGLRPVDRFNVLLFAGGSTTLSDRSLPASRENIDRAIHVLESQRGGGGTRLLPALKKALSMGGVEGYSRNFIIATDGYVAVEEEVFDLIRGHLGDANMFSFGIGSSVNRHLIEGMARVGMGEPYVVTHPNKASETVERFRKLIESPVLTGIEIDYRNFEVYDVEPLAVPDVFADRPVVVFGKYRGPANGTIHVRGITGENEYAATIDLSKAAPLKNDAALRCLWARHRIALLSDYNLLRKSDARIKEVTQLGLTYNLLTAYTSFVAVDDRKRLEGGEAAVVKQPLPLPKGVSDLAVGSAYSGAPRKMKTASSPTLAPASPQGVMARDKDSSVKKEYEKREAVLEMDGARAEEKEAAGRSVVVEIGEVRVPTGLSAKSIRAFLENHLGDVRVCLEGEGSGNGPAATLKITLTVDPSGNVVAVRVGEGGKKSRPVEQCIGKVLKKLTFPKTGGAGNVEIAIELVVGER